MSGWAERATVGNSRQRLFPSLLALLPSIHPSIHPFSAPFPSVPVKLAFLCVSDECVERVCVCGHKQQRALLIGTRRWRPME